LVNISDNSGTCDCTDMRSRRWLAVFPTVLVC